LALGAIDICDQPHPQNSSISSFHQKQDNILCSESICYQNNTRVKRKKCIGQVGSYDGNQEKEIVLNDFIVEVEDTSVETSAKIYAQKKRFSLQIGDQCHSECKPETTKKFLTKKNIPGISQQDCQECLMKTKINRVDQLQIGNYKFVNGQKCYYQCQPYSQGFSDTPFSSTSCDQCVANQANAKYIISKSNNCYEVFANDIPHIYEVPMTFCENSKELYRTEYVRQGTFNFDVLVLKKDPLCFEIDDYLGKHFNRIVTSDKCDDKSINNQDRNLVSKDSLSAPSPNKKKVNSKAKKQ
jgi:hypothetical protein